MSTHKKDVEFISSSETRIALVEQAVIHMNATLKEIKIEVIQNRELLKEFRAEIGNKIDFLDHRVNDNFKSIMVNMITLFSGLYATALGGMLLRLCHWI